MRLHPVRHHVDRGLRRAAVRDVHHVDARRSLERLHRDVLRAAVAARGIVDLPGPALREQHELGNGLRRQIVAHHHDPGDGRHHAHRHEVLHRVVRHLPDVRDHGEDAVVQHADGVAVGRGALHPLGADRPCGAGLVLDDDLLAHVLAHLLGDDADHHVDRAARLQRHQHQDRLRWITLSRARQRSGERRAREKPHQGILHRRLLPWSRRRG